MVVLLWGLEKSLAHSAVFFLGSSGEESHYLVRPDLLAKLRLFFLDTMVMPDFQRVVRTADALWPKLSIQDAKTWTSTVSGAMAVALLAWSLLLGAGAWTLATLAGLRRFRVTLALTILGQFMLHLVYGPETFLYALDWLPLLIVAIALAAQTKLRPIVLGLALLLAVAAATHNFVELRQATQSVVTGATL